LRECLKANLLPQSLRQQLVMTSTDRAGAQRRLTANWYWRRGENAQSVMLRVEAPQDLAGAAYLWLRRKERDQFYVYLPAVAKVRRVEGAGMAQALFASGFSAFDLQFVLGQLAGGQLQLQGPATVAGRKVQRWRYLPQLTPESLYDRVEMSVDNEWCLPLQADLYGGVPWKTLTIDPATVYKSGTRYLPRRVSLRDLRAETETVIQLGREQFDQRLPDRLFDPRVFYH
jgi:hypothetical protein